MCQCEYCGFRWIQMGKPSDLVKFEKEVRYWWESHKAYVLHGVITWGIANIPYFFLAVKEPCKAILTLKTGWILLILFALGYGILIGFLLWESLAFAGRWSKKPWIHILLPLICAFSLGCWYGIVWGSPRFVFLSKGIVLRNQIFLCITAGIFVLLITPIIIIRSSRVVKRKGLRPEIFSERDERWEL